VKDTGIGIPKEKQDNLFEPFRQTGNHTSGEEEGTGLGLSLVKKFVELHGGYVWVESEGENRGSTFSFVLPDSPPGEVKIETSKSNN